MILRYLFQKIYWIYLFIKCKMLKVKLRRLKARNYILKAKVDIFKKQHEKRWEDWLNLDNKEIKDGNV